MGERKLELIGLVSLFAVAIIGVDQAAMGRTGLSSNERSSVLATTSIFSNAQASPVEHVVAASVDNPKAGEQAPIYLDLGAKF